MFIDFVATFITRISSTVYSIIGDRHYVLNNAQKMNYQYIHHRIGRADVKSNQTQIIPIPPGLSVTAVSANR